MNTMISVIIPVYNSEKYLCQCLDSVINQTWENLQIICVDDGSSDKSRDILNKYALEDKRFCILNKENEGVSVARNFALEHAKGEYILFVDSDDWLDLNTIEVAIKAAREYEADIVMWSYIRELGTESRKKYIFPNDIFFEGKSLKNKLYRRMIGPYGEEIERPENMDALCPIWNKLYRAELIREHELKFYDIREIGTYEDGLFNLEVFKHTKKALFIEKYFYHYRRNNLSSITSMYKPQLSKQWDELFVLLKNYISENELDETYREALSNRIALSCISLSLNEMESNESPIEKIRKIRGILDKPHYREALGKLIIKKMPIYWQLFFLVAKSHCIVVLYGVLMAIKKIRGK